MRNVIKSILIIIVFSLLFTISANCDGLSDPFRESMTEEVSQECASPITKAGLETVVLNFFEARVKFTPNGYESDKDFRSSFFSSFNSFKTLLYSADLCVIKKKVTPEYISILEKSYLKNKEKFDSFYKTLSEKNEFFQNIPKSAALRAQLYFSLIILSFDEKSWESSRKFTHIWPFCD